MKVYFIPGLGADKRVFKHIQLPDGFSIEHVEWLQPEKKETLEQYAERLAEGLPAGEPFVLVGLSFGGMLAAEIGSFTHPEKTILIASVQQPAELPFYFKWAMPLRLQEFVPISLFKQASLAKRIFTTETDEDKALLRTIISESDPAFLRWAMGAILHWKHPRQSGKLYHIHGSSDRLLPARYTRPTHIVPNGGHLMVMNRAQEINNLLKDILLGEK